MRLTTDELEPYLDPIRALPFIQDVEVFHTEGGDERWRFDALICLHTPRQQHEFLSRERRASGSWPREFTGVARLGARRRSRERIWKCCFNLSGRRLALPPRSITRSEGRNALRADNV